MITDASQTSRTETIRRGIPLYREKSPAPDRTQAMYLVIVVSWLLLCIPMVAVAWPIMQAAFRRDDILGVAVTATVAFIAYFWLNGVKDVVYPIAYRVMPWRRQAVPRRTTTDEPSVALVYVTCNDFSGSSLAASLDQDYGNYQAVILDDSSKPEYLAQVDAFAEEHGIVVVRRPDRRGFKAGNLNNYLRGAGRKFAYFVIIDSDEVLPRNFVTRALDYFTDPGVGIVQANHIATRNRTTFMKTFAPGVDSHWPAYQLVKNHAGFLSLLGHGAMVSRDAYAATGGFPEIVSEDIGFAIDARCAGYQTVFAPDIICEEEFPVDYAAFKKRHRKWTEGNMEFIRCYSGRILFSRALRWYERLDIVLFTYSLPLTTVFSMYVVANAIVFPLLGFSTRYPLWMLVPTVAFLLAPMLNDTITWSRAPKRLLLSYLLHSVALFGSVFFASLFASAQTTFRASVFNVTPKKPGKASFANAIEQNGAELTAAAILAVVVDIASGSVLPVILIIIPAVFGIYLSVMNAGDPDSGISDGDHILLKENRE